MMSIALVLAQRRHIKRQAAAEAALRRHERTEALLRESEKFAATGRMAARIAHEINNPLGGILNAFALVKGALPPDAETQRWAQMIEREIGRIARIVRRMFELYARQKDQPEEVRFEQLLGEVADLMRTPDSRGFDASALQSGEQRYRRLAGGR
jgi:nitrogen-specific signal transduction histidine kinase